jgi:hypothetical protein
MRTRTLPPSYVHRKPQPLKKAYTLKIDVDLLAALKAIKAREGIGESEQIRRGIRMWLDAKQGVKRARKHSAKGSNR